MMLPLFDEPAIALRGRPVLKPPLKWAGGKRWQVSHVDQLWKPHAHRRWMEPCCGALGMTLGIRPERALLNDRNAHLMNFLCHLQRGLVIGDLVMAYDRTLYDGHRDRFNALVAGGGSETREAASLFYYLNRTCFNGLSRFNRRGGFNVPFGRYTSVTYTRDFSAYVPVLAPWTLTRGDFAQVVLEPDDFLYVDPPYDGTFDKYSADPFTSADQRRLVRWLGQHPGPVVACNAATPEMIACYRDAGFDVRILDAPRRISNNGDRTPARELFATRNLP
jgi:DNA adenine methylase